MMGQHGVVSRAQALADGMTTHQIACRIRGGKWVRAARGVYRHAATKPTPQARLLAACLAHKALASHRSAAAVHGLDGYALDWVELVVPSGSFRPIKGVVLHESAQLGLARPVVRQGIPCTGLARTVLDLAAVVSRRRLDGTIDALLRDQRLRRLDLYGVLASHARQGRNGCAALRASLDDRFGAAAVPLSEWSRMVAELLVSSGPGPPALEHRVRAADGSLIAQVDLAYPSRRLAIELDSVRWHLNRHSFVHDPRRRNRLLLAGWSVLTFTWDDYIRRPGRLCATVVRACQVAGGRGVSGTAG